MINFVRINKKEDFTANRLIVYVTPIYINTKDHMTAVDKVICQ